MIWISERLGEKKKIVPGRAGEKYVPSFGRLHIQVELAKEAKSSSHESEVAIFFGLL